MIWKHIVTATSYARWSIFAHNTIKTVSDFATVVQNLFLDVRDSYRPELHYMRGPGPKWRAKHQPRLKFDPKAGLPAGQHQLAPVYVRRRNAANPTR